MEDLMTAEEQNLDLLKRMIPPGEKFYVWCYGDSRRCLATTCPESECEVLEKAFRIFGGVEKAMEYAASKETLPILFGSPIGMQWAFTFEPMRNRDLVFVMGPVFYSPPVQSQIREALRPYRDTIEDAVWAGELTERLGSMPVLSHAIFARYVTMVHNTMTGQRIDVSALYTSREGEQPFPVPAPANRDKTEIYLAERALLQMVRNGDINYQDVLSHSSELSSGVSVEGRDPLQKFKISVVVFTSLVCRAAMDGGLSPEVAYPLSDFYIEAAIHGRDLGELNKLSLSMYHDFIYRVHELNSNPDYSAAVQRCCDYIALNVGRDIHIADLAALTGYTEYYLSEKFKKETGTPLFLYIRCAKVERAKLLLESTTLSVREIAEALAFNTPNYFSKCFREITGCTPAQYRKAHSR